MKSLGCYASRTLFVLSLQSAMFQSGNRLLAASPAQQTQSTAATNETPIQSRAGAALTLQSNPLPQPATGIAAADFDIDGKPDLAVVDSFGVSIFLSDGEGNFHTRASYILPDSVSVAAADFNRDGRMDLAITRADGVVTILLGNGDGTFQPPVDYAAGVGPQGLVVGDFNRDGIPDLAVANTASPAGNSAGGAVSILLGNGDGTFRPVRRLPVASGAFSVAATDLGGSGYLGLIVATSGPFGAVSVLRGNGDGTFQPPEDLRTSSDPHAQARAVRVADLNGDGIADLVVVNSIPTDSGANAEISVLLGSTSDSWQSPIVYKTGFTPAGTANVPLQLLLVDLDADGTLDLVSMGNQISVQFGNGDGTFSSPVFYPVSEVAAGAALDLDDDGLPDLVAVGRAMTILRNSPIALLTSPATVFPSTQIHTSSSPLTAKLRNPNHVPLKLSGVQLTGDFSQTNGCANELPPGSQCSIAVTFLPQARGLRTGTLSVLDAAGHLAAILDFTGEAVTQGPAVTLLPASLTFTGVRVATQATQTAQLTNTGTAPLSINSIAPTGGGQFSVASNCGTSLAANASCTLTVTFSPSFPETQTAAISITDDAPGSPQVLTLTGSGESLAFSKTNLNFQPVLVGQTSASLQTVTLFNVGPGVVTFTAIAIAGANASDFQWLPNSGPQPSCPVPGVLRAGDRCFFSISFTPSAIGLRSATLSVSDDRDPFPATIPITGTGKPKGPIVMFSAPSISFGAVPVGSSKSQFLNMTNSGDTPLSIASIQPPAEFAEFTQTNNCGTGLAAGATCQFTVTFSPNCCGAQSGALTVTDNAPGNPQSVALDGVAENIVFSKTSLVFPATPVGQTSATRSVSLFSLSGNALVIGSLTGPNAADFQVISMSCGIFGLNTPEIRRGDPCIIQLTFTPSAKGTRTAQLVFMNENPASGPSAILPLSADGI
jgi:hypothetical protein